MELGQVTKFDKKNKKTSKTFDGDVMPENCVVIFIVPIYGQFEVIWKLDSGHIVCKTYISTNCNLLPSKN